MKDVDLERPGRQSDCWTTYTTESATQHGMLTGRIEYSSRYSVGSSTVGTVVIAQHTAPSVGRSYLAVSHAATPSISPAKESIAASRNLHYPPWRRMPGKRHHRAWYSTASKNLAVKPFPRVHETATEMPGLGSRCITVEVKVYY